jgi:hypothetical protein
MPPLFSGNALERTNPSRSQTNERSVMPTNEALPFIYSSTRRSAATGRARLSRGRIVGLIQHAGKRRQKGTRRHTG